MYLDLGSVGKSFPICSIPEAFNPRTFRPKALGYAGQGLWRVYDESGGNTVQRWMDLKAINGVPLDGEMAMKRMKGLGLESLKFSLRFEV